MTIADLECRGEGRIVCVAAEPRAGIGRLRRVGLDAATGDVVAFTEDSCVGAGGWADAWRDTFADPRILAATGPVVPAMGTSRIDWAVFTCEYSLFLPSLTPERRPTSTNQTQSPILRLAGNNFAIRRSLADMLDRREIHETEVAGRLTSGVAVAAEAVVYHTRRYGLAESVRDRLRFGYEYGTTRGACLRGPLRLLALGVGPAILVAQTIRLLMQLRRPSPARAILVECLPVSLGLLTAWSVGEWLGWMRGAWKTRHVSRRSRETADQGEARVAGRGVSSRSHCTPARSSA